MRARRTFIVKLSAVLVVAAAVSPAGAYAKYDQRSDGYAVQDLRSPDARDAGHAAQVRVVQDLRSPDTRDAADHLSLARGQSSGAAASSGGPAPHAAPSVSDGFEWGDAGIGAAGTLALLSLAGGSVLVAIRTRRRTT